MGNEKFGGQNPSPAEPVTGETPEPRYFIDWLGVVRDPTDRHPVGYLICGPNGDAYTLDVNGTRKTLPTRRIRIQLVRGGEYVVGDSFAEVA